MIWLSGVTAHAWLRMGKRSKCIWRSAFFSQRYSETGSLYILHIYLVQCSLILLKMLQKRALWSILRWQVNMRDAVEWFFACTVLKIYKYAHMHIHIHMYFEVKKRASDMFGVTSGLKWFASKVISPECTWCRCRNQLVMCLWSFCVWTVPCSSVKLRVLWHTADVLFACLAGWFHSLSCCTATRTQSGSGYPSGKWHQGESEITSLAHCR